MGGVKLGLENVAAVRQEAAAMQTQFAAPLRFMVQQMVSGGLEVILGGKRDHSFGPVVMFGLGGIYVEVLGDVTFKVAPLSRADAEKMVVEVRGSRLLDGVRGQPRTDKEALIRAILSTSRMLVENPSITELDINPLMVLERGAVALDARAVISEKET
jgi:acyl-CoA synthetase (NDP forming)